MDSLPVNTSYLGDIALGFETVNKEAVVMEINRVNHLAHLVVHGILHLTGFSHKKIRESSKMQREEIRLLNLIGINNPYNKLIFFSKDFARQNPEMKIEDYILSDENWKIYAEFISKMRSKIRE